MMNRGTDLRWWRDDVREGERGERMFAALQHVRSRSSTRRKLDLIYACLYGDGGLDGLSGNAVSRNADAALQFNIVRRCVDTTHAKTAKARPLPMAQTSGGDSRARRRAQKLSRFFAGAFDKCSVFETGEQVCRDALIHGTGISHTFRVGEELRHERVLIWEIDVDKLDARYGKPRTIYLHRWVDREVLAAEYPDHADAIERASSDGFADDVMRDDETAGDFVPVVEAWRLPNGPGLKGRHTIAVNAPDGVLVDDEYERDYVPITVLHFAKPLMGFWGDGFAHLLRGIQEELNSVAMRVQEANYGMGSYIIVDKGAGIETDHIDNGCLTILEVNPGSRAPQVMNPQATSPQTMEYLGALRGPWAFDETGVSQLSATSQKPAGLDSGAALRTFSDIESERFVLFGKAYERYFVAIAWILFDLAEELVEDGKAVVIQSKHRKTLEALDFKKIRIDRKEFTLEAFPTSALSRDPAARRAEVGEYLKAGLIPAEIARNLLEIPDLEDFNSIEDAPRELVEDIIARFLDAEDPSAPGVYVYPESVMDLKLCVRLASLHYLRGRLDGTPEENLSLLMEFVTDAQEELTRMNAPPAAEGPPGMPGMPPMGAQPPMPDMPLRVQP